MAPQSGSSEPIADAGDAVVGDVEFDANAGVRGDVLASDSAGDDTLRVHGIDAAPETDATFDTDAVPSPHSTSQFCGDGIRDPLTEECDDGIPGLADPCTADCRVRDVPVVDSTLPPSEASSAPPRSLGTAPHVSSGSNLGLAVVYLEPRATSSSVKLQSFTASGTRQGAPLDIAGDYTPLLAANPALAILPDGRFAVAWTDGTDGVPEVRLRLVDSGGGLGPAPLTHATPAGLHADPDMLWNKDRLIVAWTDLLDVKYREFAGDLTPLGPEATIAATPAIESSVSLAPFANGWASAIRSNTNALESIVVQSSALAWSTPPDLPGPIGDRPALVALDDTHLLVVFTIGTDPAETGTASVGRLRAAILSTTSPGPVTAFAFGPTLAPYATDSTLGQRRPSAVRVGDQEYVAWENSPAAGAAAGEQVFVTRVALDPARPNGLAQDQEMQLPFGAPGAGSQSNVRLGASTLFPGGALISTWESASSGASRATPDLMLDFRPSPFVFLPAGDAD
jgi:hypothetical protein